MLAIRGDWSLSGTVVVQIRNTQAFSYMCQATDSSAICHLLMYTSFTAARHVLCQSLTTACLLKSIAFDPWPYADNYVAIIYYH